MIDMISRKEIIKVQTIGGRQKNIVENLSYESLKK
jgi:hypothetical protein